MAKRKGVNKSAKIREYKAANPSATPKAIVDGLAKSGLKVSYALVSNILYRGKKRPTAKKPGRRGRPAKVTITGDDLVRLKQMVNEMGGVAAVKSGLAMLEKLQ